MFELSANPPAPENCSAHDNAFAALEAALALREAGHGQVRITDASTGSIYRLAEFSSSYWTTGRVRSVQNEKPIAKG